jgi:RND superfamily putative drug exporter
VAGANVTVRPDDGSPALTATTDSGGWYELRGNIRPGIRSHATAEAKGYLPLGGVDVTDMILKQNTLPTLTLTGTGATLAGQVIGPAGVPVPAAEVSLIGPAGELLAQANTDAAGYYRIAANLPRYGVVTLTAARTGWSRALADVSERPAAGATVSRDLVIFPETATLEGRARGADGTPSAGVWVDLLEEGGGVIDSARTLEGGYFQFTNVRLTGSAWFSLRVRAGAGATFGGSLTHGTEVVPMLRLAPGERTVTDLLVTGP